MDDEMKQVCKALDMPTMTASEFVNRLHAANKHEVVNVLLSVMQMRETQKAYFKTKDRSLLIRSKELESLVDKELDELLK